MQMETSDNNSKDEKHGIPLRLQRFLMTVARRKGIENIMVGAVVIDQNNALIVDSKNRIPHKTLGRDGLESTLTNLAYDIGIRGFSIVNYAGAVSGIAEDGTALKQYNFIIAPNMASEKLGEGFSSIDIGSGMPEFLNQDEIKMLTLILEKRKLLEQV